MAQSISLAHLEQILRDAHSVIPSQYDVYRLLKIVYKAVGEPLPSDLVEEIEGYHEYAASEV